MITVNFIDKIKDYFDRPKSIDYYNVFSQIYMLLTSGSTLQQAIRDITPYQEKKSLKNSLISIQKSLAIGLSTGAAFRKENVFPKIVAPSLEAGDRAGALSRACYQLSEMFYLQHNLYSKIQNALFVPKMSAVLMILMTIGYTKITLPEFIKLYNDTGLEIPPIIAVVHSVVNSIVDHWYFTILFIYLCWKCWTKFAESNLNIVDGFKLRIPIYKKLHFLFLQHQFSSTVSLMLSSGLTIPDALMQAQKVVDNVYMADSISLVRTGVLKGLSLTDSMTKNNKDKIFDRMLIASINAGERSANLSSSLDSNCKYYERTLNNMIDPVSTKLTLIVIVPMGIMIVAMYIFTMIPMFNFMGQIN